LAQILRGFLGALERGPLNGVSFWKREALVVKPLCEGCVEGLYSPKMRGTTSLVGGGEIFFYNLEGLFPLCRGEVATVVQSTTMVCVLADTIFLDGGLFRAQML